MTWRPDPSFYPSPRMAMKAPAEKFAYVAAFDPTRQKPDAIAVVDVDPGSKTYANILGNVEMPSLGDELHHFGWNACSSCLCPNAPHPHVERRYLVVPGLRSSRIHILDTKTRATRRSSKSSNPRRSRRKPATRGPTPYIAVPAASMSLRSAIRTARRRVASL